MATEIFKDARDRAWSFHLTYGDVKRVKSELGINLAKPGLGTPDGVDIADIPEEKQQLQLRIAQDPMLLTDIVFAVIKPQAVNQDVTQEDFDDSITPPIFKQIEEVFWSVYRDFFLESGNEIQAKMTEMIMKAVVRMNSKIDALSESIDRKMEAAEREIDEKISTS